MLAFATQAESLLQGIDGCLERLPQSEALIETCPYLPATLGELTSSEADWSARLAELHGNDARSFLQTLRDNAMPRSSTVTVLDPDIARAEVAKLKADAATQAPGLWARFVAWVKSLSGQDSQDSATPGWLQRLLDSVTVTESVGETIFWISSALIVLMAIAFIVSEVRARRSPQPHTAGYRVQEPPGELAPADSDLDHLAAIDAGERPAAMLRIAIEHLRAAGLLRQDDSLTNRELAQQLDPRSRGWFVGLSSLADAVIFGQLQPSSEQLDSAKQSLQQLLQGTR